MSAESGEGAGLGVANLSVVEFVIVSWRDGAALQELRRMMTRFAWRGPLCRVAAKL
jgi:hypothetical protein